jgi:hypothetical protein
VLSFSFTTSSKFFSWILINCSGHVHVCHWVGKTLSLVKNHVHVHMLKNNCVHMLNIFLTILLFLSLLFIKTVYRDTYRIVNEIPWYVSYREVVYCCISRPWPAYLHDTSVYQISFESGPPWSRHRSHTTTPLTSSPRQFESCSDWCDSVRKFVSLLAEGRWSLPKYIV